MAAPTTLRERRQQHTRDDLAQTTLDLIIAEGVAAVTIERLCLAAGTSRATLYAHFPDGRDSILRAAYLLAGDLLVRRAREAAAGATTWDARIASYARTMIEFSGSAELGYFYSVAGPALFGFRADRGVGSQGYFDDIGRELVAAQDAGDLPATNDPEALAVLLVSSLRDAGIAAAHAPHTAERYVAAVQALLDGLKSRRAHS